MPELPDVETWKRYVDATSLHQEICAVEVDAPRMLQGVSARRLKDRLRRREFAQTRRHGKYLFVRADAGDWLVLHFGMTGFLRYAKAAPEGRPPPRLSVRFASGYRLDGFWPRRLGRISLAEDWAAFVAAEGLGPDPVESDLDRDAFVRMFEGRGGSLKGALMDQKFLAGLGNIYSDEVLYQARLHPRSGLRDLRRADLSRLYRAMHHVLRIAVERKAEPGRLPASWLLPHRKQGEACPRCRGAVGRLRIGGRTAYLCPACQREPAAR